MACADCEATFVWGHASGCRAKPGSQRLPSEVETALYRIAQEALTNITKHAHARSVSIVLGCARGIVTAVIEDDGSGFDPGAAGDGTGLEGMRERLSLIGEGLKIESRPGYETTLVAAKPPTRATRRSRRAPRNRTSSSWTS